MIENILLVVSVLLIVIVLFQSNKATDTGNLMGGGNEVLFKNMKERGLELVISRVTLALGILFFILSLVLFLI